MLDQVPNELVFAPRASDVEHVVRANFSDQLAVLPELDIDPVRHPIGQ